MTIDARGEVWRCLMEVHKKCSQINQEFGDAMWSRVLEAIDIAKLDAPLEEREAKVDDLVNSIRGDIERLA